MKKIKIINKTPHKVVLIKQTCHNDTVYNVSEDIFESDCKPLRLTTEFKSNDVLTHIIPCAYTEEFIKNKFHQMPNEIYGVFYIVSRIIFEHYPERNDLLVPADFIRDESGNIVGCTKWIGRNNPESIRNSEKKLIKSILGKYSEIDFIKMILDHKSCDIVEEICYDATNLLNNDKIKEEILSLLKVEYDIDNKF